MSKKRVLITGGAGFVGRVLADMLTECQYTVRIVDDLSNPQSRAPAVGEFIVGDIADTEIAKAAFANVDYCIALASRRGSIGFVDRNPTDILTGNTAIYNASFQAAVAADVQRFVYVSSSMVFEAASVYPTPERHINDTGIPVSHFGMAKILGEHYCRSFAKEQGLKYTIIRPSNVYGPEEKPGDKPGDSHVIPDLFKKFCDSGSQIEVFGDGMQSRCFVHRNDIARGIVAALKSADAVNQDFNMGGAEEIRILDLAQEIWNAMGGGGNIQPVFVKGFPQDVSRQFMSCDKARGILGWEPEIFFKDGLKDMVGWLAGADARF